MLIVLKKNLLEKKIKNIIIPPLDAGDQRNIYVTEDDEQYYPEDIEDVLW
jgi:hypothetical protein